MTQIDNPLNKPKGCTEVELAAYIRQTHPGSLSIEPIIQDWRYSGTIVKTPENRYMYAPVGMNRY